MTTTWNDEFFGSLEWNSEAWIGEIDLPGGPKKLRLEIVDFLGPEKGSHQTPIANARNLFVMMKDGFEMEMRDHAAMRIVQESCEQLEVATTDDEISQVKAAMSLDLISFVGNSVQLFWAWPKFSDRQISLQTIDGSLVPYEVVLQ